MNWKMSKSVVLLMLVTATRCLPAAVREGGRNPADGSAGERSEEMKSHQDGEDGQPADGTKYKKEQSQLAHQFKDVDDKRSGSGDDVRQEEKRKTDDVINGHKDSNQSTHKDNRDDKEVSQSADEALRRHKESNQSTPRAGHLGGEVIQSAHEAKNRNKQTSQSGDEATHPAKAQQIGVLAKYGEVANPISTDEDSKQDHEPYQSTANQNNDIVQPPNKNRRQANEMSQEAKAGLLPSSATGKGKASSKDSVHCSTKKGTRPTEPREERKSLTLKQKLERYIALYKLAEGRDSDADITENGVLQVLSSVASSHDLTEEELAEIICAILCGLGTCPPSCPGYYEPPWGPSENLTRSGVLDG